MKLNDARSAFRTDLLQGTNGKRRVMRNSG